MNVARVLSFVATALATLKRAPGAGDVAALDALGLVEAAEVGLGHVESGGGGRLLRRTIAIGYHGGRGRRRRGGVARRLAAGSRRRRGHRTLDRATVRYA